MDGKLTLEIFDVTNRIFIDTFTARDLLGDTSEIIDGNISTEDTIKKRIDSFFSEKNFFTPATNITHSSQDTISSYILSDQEPDNPNIESWLDIRSDTSAIGFGYAYGYEGYYMIAYSKKKKQVAIYFTSD